MTTSSEINFQLYFLQRQRVRDYHRQNHFITLLRKCTRDESLSEEDETLAREIFRHDGEYDDRFWENVMSFAKKNPFLLIGELDYLLRIIVDFHDAPILPDISNLQLARDTAKELFQMRQRRFVKDMAGRTSEERSSVSRTHITKCNDLKQYLDGMILDFTTVDATDLDFTGLDVSSLQFGRNSVSGSNFCQTNIRLDQLRDVQSFLDCHFDSEFQQLFLDARELDCQETLRSVTASLEEAAIFHRSMDSYYLLASHSGEFDLTTLLAETSDEELRCMTFMLMNDRTINLLPEDGEFSYEWCSERRDIIMTMPRDALFDLLRRMLQHRQYYLPSEVLSHAIDHKLYMLQFSMDQLKQQLQYYAASISSFPDPIIRTSLQQQFSDLRRRVHTMNETLESARTDNNRLRIQLFLANLQAPVDPELGYGPTDRLIECLNLAKLIPNTIVDLNGKDLSGIDFSRIEVSSGAWLSVSMEDEIRFLPEKLIQQRYAIMYEHARTGALEVLHRYIVDGNLDVNRQEVGSLRTALSYACGNGHFTVARMLIDQHHARLDLKTAHQWTIMDFLASAAGVSTTDNFNEGVEFLHYLLGKGLVLTVHQAAEIGDLETLRAFSMDELKSCCPIRNRTVLEIAACRGSVPMVRYLKQKLVPMDEGQRNPLWDAAELGYDAVVQELTLLCPSLITKKVASMTPMEIALHNKQWKVVAVLAQYEASTSSNQPHIAVALSDLESTLKLVQDAIRVAQQARQSTTPTVAQMAAVTTMRLQTVMPLLYYACLYDRETIFKFLLTQCDADALGLIDFEHRFVADYNRRLVDIACFAGNISMMKILMTYRSRFDVNASTSMCPALLFVALAKNNLTMVQYLLDEVGTQLQVHQATHLGKSALQWLFTMKRVDEHQRLDVARKLVKLGCSVYDRDAGQNSLLHYAASISTAMVQLILDTMLRQVTNAEGKTVRDLANESSIDLPTFT